MNLQENRAAETVVLQVPSQVYARAKQVAGENPEALKQLLVSAMTSGFSLVDDLPDDMVLDMAALALLNDQALWYIARQTMPDERYQAMDYLLAIQGQGALNSSQRTELDEYLAESNKIMLQRAHAALLLQQRGYDLSDPKVLTKPASDFA